MVGADSDVSDGWSDDHGIGPEIPGIDLADAVGDPAGEHDRGGDNADPGHVAAPPPDPPAMDQEVHVGSGGGLQRLPRG